MVTVTRNYKQDEASGVRIALNPGQGAKGCRILPENAVFSSAVFY